MAEVVRGKGASPDPELVCPLGWHPKQNDAKTAYPQSRVQTRVALEARMGVLFELKNGRSKKDGEEQRRIAS
jgi:hypothetical protein